MVGAERVVEEEVADPISFLAQYIVACIVGMPLLQRPYLARCLEFAPTRRLIVEYLSLLGLSF